MASNSKSSDNLSRSKPRLNRSISSDSFSNLAVVNNQLDEERRFFFKQLNKNHLNNNLTRQFFTLGLLEYVCNILNPKDALVANGKFKEICQILVKFDVIGVDLTSDLFKQIRFQYQKLLFAIFNKNGPNQYPQLTYDLKRSTSLQQDSSLSEKYLNVSLDSPNLQKPELISRFSRYNSDFEELEKIASGGFGSVYKARNILDENEYAIKKIYLKDYTKDLLKKVNLEVRVFSSLIHENIVNYHCSWVEFDLIRIKRKRNKTLVPHEFESSESEKDNNPSNESEASNYIITNGLSDENEINSAIESVADSDIVFEQSEVSQPSSRKGPVIQEINDSELSNINSKSELSSILNGGRFYQEHTNESYSGFTSSNGLSTNDVVTAKDRVTRALSNPSLASNDEYFENVMVLYIQMKLCDTTMKNWLNKRNEEFYERNIKIDGELNSNIFRQILSGVEYIHSHNIIHRDLKPGNIFFMYNGDSIQVKIGDFGLACLDTIDKESQINPETSPVSPIIADENRTKGVGTLVYASPEQTNGLAYDSKSDMYSLGIIFFELYHPFRTNMEKVIEIENLKKGILPTDMDHWKTQSDIIKLLISKKSSERPSAFSVLNSELFLTKDQIIANLYTLLKQKDEHIKLLKEELTIKNDIIEKKDDLMENFFKKHL